MRYGNKSVISEIREDEDMPYTEDGRKVDVLLNLLGIINRTTSFAIYELAINAITYQTRRRMKSLKTYKQKENLLFDIIHEFNEEQYAMMKKDYDKLNDEEKKDVIDDAIENGIYIHQSPTHETKPIFYRIRDILEKNDWLQPETIYINKYGRKIKTMSKHWLGTMYLLKLKQSDLRGFSARSTGAIDIKGLPTRSYKSRNHMEKWSDSAIRFGEFESLNFSIGIPTEDIALFHSIYRTSIKGREDLVKLMFKMYDVDKNGESKSKIDNSYTSRVAEIFKVIMKSLSLEIDFQNDDDVLSAYDTQNVSIHTLDGQTYLCTDYQFFLLKQANEIKEEILNENLVMTEDELQKEIERRLRQNKYLNGRMYDENGNLMFD